MSGNDLISRSMIVKVFRERSKSVVGTASKVYEAIAQEFEGWPAVNAVPVRHGKWIKGDYACGDNEWKCSVCGETEWTGSADWMKFCMYCGARMDEGGSGDGEAQD